MLRDRDNLKRTITVVYTHTLSTCGYIACPNYHDLIMYMNFYSLFVSKYPLIYFQKWRMMERLSNL